MYLYPYAQLRSVSDLCCLPLLPPSSRRLLPRIPLPLKLSDGIPPPDITRRYVTSLTHIHSLHVYIYVQHLTYIYIYRFAFSSLCSLVYICAHSYTSAFRARCALLQLRCRGLALRENSAYPKLNFHAFVSYISRFLQAASYDIAVDARTNCQRSETRVTRKRSWKRNRELE